MTPQIYINLIANQKAPFEITIPLSHYISEYALPSPLLEFQEWEQSLLQNVRIFNTNLSMNEDVLTLVLPYEDNTLTESTNNFLLNSVIEHITSTKRFNDPLIL